MTIKSTKKQLFFNCFQNIYTKFLLIIVLGIFLLPNISLASAITSEKIIELTNKERQTNNLNSLTANQFLTQAAYQKGLDIFENETFQHSINDKKFSAWIKETGYEYSYVGENLAIDFITAEGVVDAWLASEGHKENLLNSIYKEIGVAVIENEFEGQNTILVVQIFGTPIITNAQVLAVTQDNSTLNQSNSNESFLSGITKTEFSYYIKNYFNEYSSFIYCSILSLSFLYLALLMVFVFI